MFDMVRVRRAFRRSRLRAEILLALEGLGRASGRDVALALGAEPANVHGALVGSAEAYRVEESLVALGLVVVEGRGEPVFGLSLAGREVAVSLRRARVVRAPR